MLWKANAQKCKSCLVRRLSEALNAVDVDVGEPDVPGDVWPEEDVVGREVPGDHDFKPGVSPSHPQRRLNRDQLGRLVHVQNVSAKENGEFSFKLDLNQQSMFISAFFLNNQKRPKLDDNQIIIYGLLQLQHPLINVMTECSSER